MRRVSARTWAAVLAAGIALVAGCSGGPDKDALPDGEKAPQPLAISAKSQWDERKLGMERVVGAELRGRTAIVAGDCECGGNRLAVVDAETADPRWVLDSGDPLRGGDGARAYGENGHLRGNPYPAGHLQSAAGKPLVIGDGDDWTVFVQYVIGDETQERERGVAALSGRDGAVRWKRALIEPRSGRNGQADRKQATRLLAADDRMVLVSLESEGAATLTTVAIDATGGRELWRHDDGWGYQIAGDLVLGETRADTEPPWHSTGKDDAGAVIALDAATGRRRWDLTGRYEKSELEASAGGVAVISVKDRTPVAEYSDRRTLVVNAATGGGEKALPETFYDCDSDGRTLVACVESHAPRLVTIRSGGRSGIVTAEKKAFPAEVKQNLSIDAVSQDRIFVSGSVADEGVVRYTVVDRAANTLRTGLPGPVAAVSDRDAVFFVKSADGSSGPTGLVAHRASVGGKGKPPEPGGAGKPTVEPVQIGRKPLWSGRAGDDHALTDVKNTDLIGITRFQLADDALLYTGQSRSGDGPRLTVVDAATGKARWSITRDRPLGGGVQVLRPDGFRVVGEDGRRLVLVTYRRMSAGEEGVMALSLKNGEVHWRRLIVTRHDDRFASLDAADDRTLTVSVSTFRGSRSRDETIAFATTTGRRLWNTSGLRAEAVAGDLIVARRERPRTDLVALDASTGRRRWSLAGRYKSPEVLHTADAKALVVRTADGTVVLDLSTGRELARTFARPAECGGEGALLIVCRVGPASDDRPPNSHAVTIELSDGQAKIKQLLGTFDLFQYAGFGPYFFANRPERTGFRYVAMDGAGREVANGMPGSLGTAGDRYAVFYVGSIHEAAGLTFTVHRVSG